MSLRPGTVLDVGVNVGQTLLKIKALEWARDDLALTNYLAVPASDRGAVAEAFLIRAA